MIGRWSIVVGRSQAYRRIYRGAHYQRQINKLARILYALRIRSFRIREGTQMTDPDITFRPATVEDCEIILRQRRGMFRDMGDGTPVELDRMVEAGRPWMKRALADGS